MDAWILSLKEFKTLGRLNVTSYDLCLASASPQQSKVTAVGQLPYTYNRAWLYMLNHVWLISKINPAKDKTVLTLQPPEALFGRRVPYSPPTGGITIGQWLCQQITDLYINQADREFAVPYLIVSNSDTPQHRPPELDRDGLYSLSDYMNQCAIMDGLCYEWSVNNRYLHMNISTAQPQQRNILFGDGHSTLLAATYASSSVGKITALQQVDTGDKDQDGKSIYRIEPTDWFLSADGDISTSVPDHRAAGDWISVLIKPKDDQLTKVRETFAKYSYQHKVEFVSERQLQLFDQCSLMVHDKTLQTIITSITLTSEDNRYHYIGGNLKTTATDKLKGVRHYEQH